MRRLEIGEVAQGQGIGVPETDRTLQDRRKLPEIPGPAVLPEGLPHLRGQAGLGRAEVVEELLDQDGEIQQPIAERGDGERIRL